jgi:hypothetical protein
MGELIKKQKRKTNTVICNNYGKSFEKAISEINRTEKKGGKHYCGRSCCGKSNVKNNFKEFYGLGNLSNLSSNNRRDEHTGFREFINRARYRKKLGELSLQDLKEQWNKQNGICPYTGILLKFPQARKRYKIFETASLDRVDSTKLYEKGNVVFVSVPINYMKNTMSEEETIDFCKKIAYHWNK